MIIVSRVFAGGQGHGQLRIKPSDYRFLLPCYFGMHK